jgi:hypothetical protein
MTARISKPCPQRDEFQKLLAEAVARFEAMTPEAQRAMRREQAISFVYGNLMDCPGITREMVARAYDRD